MTRARSGSRLLRILLAVVGGIMMGLGVLSVGYGLWAWAEGLAYLADVTASGQTVEAFDAANFVMSSAGLFLLVGLLLVGHGGLFLVARRLLSRPALLHPVMPAAPRPARPVPQEDDLDDLLDDIEA